MSRAPRGFTLVEMLVALAVAALLVSLVYGAVRVGQRSVYALDRQVGHLELMRIGWQFVREAIAHASPADDPARSYSRTGFEGTSDRLVFVADMPSYVGIEGPMRISLGAVATPDGDQLLLTRERLEERDAAAGEAPLEQAVLVEHLDGLQIEYFGQIERGEPPTWQTFWGGERGLPNLIRIQVRPADGPAWPLLIAAPKDGTVPLGEDILPDGTAEDDLSTGVNE